MSQRVVPVLAVAVAALLVAGAAAAVTRAPGEDATTQVQAGQAASETVPLPTLPTLPVTLPPLSTDDVAPAVTVPTLPAVTLPRPPDTTTTTRPAMRLDEGSVYVSSSDGSGLVRLGHWSEFRMVRPSPDGARLAFYRDSKLWVSARDGSGATPVTSERVCCNFDWSPDGAEIAYEVPRENSNDRRILSVPSGGGTSRVLAESGNFPVWAPAGGRVMFGSGVALMVRDPDGTTRQIAPDVLGLSAWSPDGSELLTSFTDPATGKPGTFVMRADGSGGRRIEAAGDHRRSALSWSPDGGWVTWGGAWPTPESEIRTMIARPDGSGAREIMRGTVTPLWVAPWNRLVGRPDGALSEIVSVDGTGRGSFLDSVQPHTVLSVSADGRTAVVSVIELPPPGSRPSGT